MRICFVTDDRICVTPDGTYYSNTGYDWRLFAGLWGPELEEIRFLTRVNEVEAAPEGWVPHIMDDRVTVVGLPWFHKYRALTRLPRAVLQLRNHLRDADLVWLVVPNVYPTVAYPVARALRRPVLAWCLGDVSETALLVYDEVPMRLAYRLYARVTRAIVRRADVGAVASQTLAKKYAGRRPFVVAYRSQRDPSLLACDRPERPPRAVVYLGRLSPEKGPATLVDAFAQVVGKLPDARLIFVGDGAQRDELELAVKRRGIEHAVEFRGWVPYGPELKEVLASADVLALPSYSEGMPSALLEGMAAGLPVVGTTAGDIPAVVSVHGAGTIVPPRDAEALAEALLDVMQNFERYRAMSEAASKTAREMDFEHETGRVVHAGLDHIRRRSGARP